VNIAKLGRAIPLMILAACLVAASVWVGRVSSANGAEQSPAAATPADGYTIHVTAPHNVNGHIMGPFHHFCKVMKPDPPFIVCQIYDSADPNATLTQIEFIIGKKLTRPAVSLSDWNLLWHDHAAEIATGRVQVLDLPPDKAKAVADLVATTDGIIYSIQFDNNLPNGKIVMAQSVGHRPLTAQEYEQSKKDALAAPAPH
jgi:uncharacterized protein DUF1264